MSQFPLSILRVQAADRNFGVMASQVRQIGKLSAHLIRQEQASPANFRCLASQMGKCSQEHRDFIESKTGKFFAVQSIGDVIQLSADSLKTLPSVLRKGAPVAIWAIGILNEELLLILDLDRIVENCEA